MPERISREEIVAAQYDVPDAAIGYAESYRGDGPEARFFWSRMDAVTRTLDTSPGGELLDAGCGPGMMVRELLRTRPGDFRITALDRSPAMVRACAEGAGPHDIRTVVGRIEEMGFPDASFDVVLAMGSLEYCDINHSLAELARVTRPDGLVLVTMLNPVSPYRLVEWHVFRPLLRLLGAVERLFKVPPDKRHGAAPNGIRAFRERTLRRLMADARLRPVDSTYFDVTPFVPPLDRLRIRKCVHAWQNRPRRPMGKGWWRRLGTAYLVVAQPA